jgi:hypothetical protein
VVLFNAGRHGPARCQSVTTHDHDLLFSIFIQIGSPHRLAVFCSQFEYMSDFDSPGEFKRPLAAWAGIRFPGNLQIRKSRYLEITAFVDIPQVIVFFVGAHDDVFSVSAANNPPEFWPFLCRWPGKSARGARDVLNHVIHGQFKFLASEIILDLDLVDLFISANQNSYRISVGIKNQRLDNLLRVTLRNAQTSSIVRTLGV